MEINANATAVPYRFTDEEAKLIMDTFSNPLILSFIKATKSNIMQERFELNLTNVSAAEATTAILVQEAMCRGQLELLDHLGNIANNLKIK